MPPTLSRPSGVAAGALFFITVGALLTVWSVVWFFYLQNHADVREGVRYICYGLMATGVVLLAIGFGAGPIGRRARKAELPPEDDSPSASANSPVQGTPVRNV